MIRALFVVIAVWTPFPVQAQFFGDDSRSWGSRDGRSSVVGTLESLSDDETTVFLTRGDSGKRVQVPVDRLSALDYLYVRDYARRSSAEIRDGEFQHIPLATRSGDSVSARWTLFPAVSIYLPPGTTIWKLLSSQPILFGAFAKDDDRFPELTVYFDPRESDQMDRLKRILEQNEATDRFLEERGFSTLDGGLLQEDPSLGFQKALRTGTNTSGESLSCETHLRFDYRAMLVFRIFGNADRIQEMIPTIDDFRHLESESEESNSLAVGIQSATPVLESDLPSGIPVALRDDFERFREQAIGLLSRANNAKEVLERLAEPQGLSKLKSNANRWDTAVISFDVRKRLRLKTVLQTLDWKTAVFDDESQRLSFSLPDTIEFVKSEQEWKILN